MEGTLHDGQQQIGDECHPYLYLDGTGTLAVEEVQREVLLDLLEQRLYLSALFVNGYNVLWGHVEVVGQQGDALPLPLIRICHNEGIVYDDLSIFSFLVNVTFWMRIAMPLVWSMNISSDITL